ncbi:NADH dehydrogenase subunit M [Sulfuritortus calidifontis]|uniref:NADH dehydrogenase subunit M n=1 Tax=Sulfuritortus calidifontis TaxID=1914471 RepID=A0A4R3JW80_9PROT|nr:NADH-quinone oxidoreductase subunit M [Sulfuritortus calidifontis]TCS72365.1 NADH dehydrogenase subunit M [Sulfuritortus calidifontis]
MELSLLSLLLLTFPLGAGLIWLLPRPGHARTVALATTLAGLALSLLVLAAFDPKDAGFQLIERMAWIPTLRVNYLVGVDGISVLFLPFTALLFVGVVVASWTSVRQLPRLYYSLLLLQAAATLGIFCALDVVLFFLFWELSLLPFYFLVSLWGVGPNRRYAATKYTLVMLGGGVPLLFGFLALIFGQAEVTGLAPAFDLPTLLGSHLSHDLQILVFLLLLLGFAVKTPVLPLHTWLPLLAMEGPVAVVALLTGLKLGAYGLIRFAVPLAPQAAQELHWLLAGLGVAGVLYGALLALAQTNLRAMLAYSSVSHVGLVLLGIAAFNLQGLQGAVLQLLNFTVAAGGIFLLAGFLQHRLGSTDVVTLGGAAKTMPWLASFFLLFGLAGMGVPGTNGFPAELLIFVAALQTHTGAGLAALFGMVLSAGYFLIMYRRAFLGPVENPAIASARDLRPRELILATVLAVLVLAIGLFPALVLDLIRPAAGVWLARLG